MKMAVRLSPVAMPIRKPLVLSFTARSPMTSLFPISPTTRSFAREVVGAVRPGCRLLLDKPWGNFRQEPNGRLPNRGAFYPIANFGHFYAGVGLRCHNSTLRPSMLPKVKSGEAGETTFDEPTLQRELEKAVEEEDYNRAAKLRDDLRAAHDDGKAAVMSANAGFYRAFRNGDLAAMRSIWAEGENVYIVHPGAGRISGYELVMESWEVVCGAEHEFPIQIDLKNVEVHVRGDVGYVTCLEVVKTKGSNWGKQVATNVFERVGDRWLMCIHHASHMLD